MDFKFTKMHAAGNDFFIIDETQSEIIPEEEKPNFVKQYSKRHFGIGSDGAIFVQKSEKADLKFHFFNPDGSIAEMCGNGIRCLAKYAYENQIISKKTINVETLAGNLELILDVKEEKVIEIQVDMGVPKIKNSDIPVNFDEEDVFINQPVMAGGFENSITAVSMGNPHAVIFLNNIDDIDVKTIGSRIRNHTSLFPQGVNVHFVEKMGEYEFRLRTYERGVEDETLACGTGICASAVAAILNKKATNERELVFHAVGGKLKVQVVLDDGIPVKATLIGDADFVYEGIIKKR